MANINVENKFFVPTGMEIVLHNDQETKNWRECGNNVIAAEPISWRRPEDAFGEVEGDGSNGKTKGSKSELDVDTEKEFSLVEIYEYSNNIDEIISQREKEGITLDSAELLKNLKGWTVRRRTYPKKNGKNRVDKSYGHPKSTRLLRSTVEIMKFIEEISCKRKASKSSERVSPQDATTKMYLEISRRLQETFGNSAHQTSNNPNKRSSSSSWSDKHEAIRGPETAYGTTFKTQDTVDYRPHLHRPSHYPVSFFSSSHKAPLSSHITHVTQSKKTSDASKQVITDNGRGCVKTFGVGQPSCYNFGASSKKNKASLNDINMMVLSQLEMQIEAKVAAHVAKTVSHYEKAQKEMAEKIESMERLLLVRGKSPPFQFPYVRKP